MDGTIKFWLAECTLLTLLVVSISASGPLGRSDIKVKYEVEFFSTYQLGPQNTTTRINGFTEVYAFPADNSMSSWNIALKNTRFSIRRKNGEEINLSSCKSFVNPYISSPYLAVFNNNGVLRKIEVPRNEDDYTVNLKFSLSTFFELNNPQIREQSPAVETREEPFYVGVCPVTYELLRNDGNGDIRIRRSLEVAECDNIKNDVKNAGLECYGNTCSNGIERNLKWPAYLNVTVKELNGMFYLEDAFINQKISYNPFKNSNAQLSVDITHKIKKVPVDNTENIPIFYPTEVESVLGTRYKNISTSLSEVNDDKTDLRQLYSAVSCLQTFAEVQGHLETALTCEQPENK